MQQQQLHQAHDGRLALETKTGAVKTRIRDVWKHNLAQEMAVLRHLVEKYPYISMVCFFNSFFPPSPSPFFCTMLMVLGHGVPWNRCASYRFLYHESRLPLPNSPVQRRPA